MWFIAALLTAIAWGAANLFYKKGSQPTDRFSHLKIVTMVGFVMGIHAFIYLFIIDFNYNPIDMLRYLPVSALYIVSMTRSEEHTSELQSRENLVCRLLL